MPAIHVVSGEHGGWIVREDGGREFGPYPTPEAAKAVGHKLALKRATELLVRDGSGKVHRSRDVSGWHCARAQRSVHCSHRDRDELTIVCTVLA